MQVPQFVLYTQSASPGYWSIEVINYNGSPYMISGATIEEFTKALNEEKEIDEFGATEIRMVNTQYGQLYQLDELGGHWVEIHGTPALTNPADRYFLQEFYNIPPFNG